MCRRRVHRKFKTHCAPSSELGRTDPKKSIKNSAQSNRHSATASINIPRASFKSRNTCLARARTPARTNPPPHHHPPLIGRRKNKTERKHREMSYVSCRLHGQQSATKHAWQWFSYAGILLLLSRNIIMLLIIIIIGARICVH